VLLPTEKENVCLTQIYRLGSHSRLMGRSGTVKVQPCFNRPLL